MIGPVDGDQVRCVGVRGFIEGDLVEREGLELQLRGGPLEIGAQPIRLENVRRREEQHHGEVSAQDRHLRVLDVDSVLEQRPRDRRDDAGSIAPDR
jgi:hypothetical protein